MATLVGGFSLLEVLAAFVILALVGTALFRVFAGALGNASLSDEYSQAILYAESQLATMGVDAPAREGTTQGVSDDGKYAWSARIDAFNPPLANTPPEQDHSADTMQVRLWRFGVTVHWPGTGGNDRSVALSTVRLAPKDLTP
jgi:general secretion pathway protein I